MEYNIKVEEFIIDDTRSFKYGEKANNYITDIDYINFRRMKMNVDVTPFDKWNGIEVGYLDYLTAVHIIPEDVFLSDIDDNHRWMAFSYYHRDPETHKCDYKTTESRFNYDTPKGRQFHIIQLIMHLAEYEYGIDVEGNSLTKFSITFDSHINYSDDITEQTWMLIRGLMSNFIISYAMIDTYNQLLKEEESMDKDSKLVVGDSFDDVDAKLKTDSDEEQKAEHVTTKSYTVDKTSIGTNYISRLEFVEAIKEAIAKGDPVDFDNDMYNGVPINALMEFVMVGCIPRFVRVHKDFPGNAIVIVDVPSTKNPEEHYERCQFLIKNDAGFGYFTSIMTVITDNIIPNYLNMSFDDMEKDMNTMALECCNKPNQEWTYARFITYLTRRIKLLETQRLMASEESDEDTSPFNWSDLELSDEYNAPDEMFLSQDVQDKYDALQDFISNKLDMFKDINDSNKDYIFKNTNKPELFSRAETDNAITEYTIQDANTITANARKYDTDAILNDVKEAAEFCKNNKDADAGVVSAIVMRNILVFTYKIGDITKVSIGRDIGCHIELLYDKKHTKIDKKFVDKIYHVEDNVIDILKLIFNLK